VQRQLTRSPTRADARKGVVLGPEVQQQQVSTSALRFDHVLEELAARGVEPVEIIDHRHHRLRLGDALDHLVHHGEQLTLPRLGVEARSGTLRVGDAQEVEQQLQRVGEGEIEQHHAAGDLLSRAAVVVLERDAEVGTEHLEDGQVGEVLGVRHGAALADS
jgi:hypothetical protein